MNNYFLKIYNRFFLLLFSILGIFGYMEKVSSEDVGGIPITDSIGLSLPTERSVFEKIVEYINLNFFLISVVIIFFLPCLLFLLLIFVKNKILIKVFKILFFVSNFSILLAFLFALYSNLFYENYYSTFYFKKVFDYSISNKNLWLTSMFIFIFLLLSTSGYYIAFIYKKGFYIKKKS